MSFPLINAYQQFFDSSGSPLASGTIEFRDPSTNDLINSYPTADDADAQTNANDNPLTLNGSGAAANGLFLEDGVKYKVIIKDSGGTTIATHDDVRCPQYTAPLTSQTRGPGVGSLNIKGGTVSPLVTVQAYTRTATVVESRTLAANASATAANNNSVLAALIADLQQKGLIP